MLRTARRVMLALAVLVALVAFGSVSPRLAAQSGSRMPSTANGEWPHYSGDIKGSRYSPLDQIDASNFNDLEVAWTFKTDNLGPMPEYKLEGTPLMVNGVVYATGGTSKSVVALDAKTGELIWVYHMDEGRRAEVAPRKLSGRGLSYWTDGRGDERVIYVTIGYRLVELDAKTGQPVATFGDAGVVDLKQGVVYMKDKQIPLETGEIGLHSTPLVVGDKVIVQSSMKEGLGYEYATNTKGLVRAYDARTGRELWRFNTIPMPGEFGNETWEDGSWEWSGNVGVWTEMSADPELGLVYLPVETPTIDVYGGNRPGDNLFSESVVAVDLNTGERKWHFQMVHHGLWDYDAVGAPMLIDATIDGQARKLVCQASKQGWLYTFDRVTGEPIWPMPEKPVPQSTVPGEKTSPTQPFPSKPPAYSRNYLATDDVIDFTPELHAQALENLKKYQWEQTPFVPYVIPSDTVLGAIQVGNTMGGVNWPGSGFDPETGIFYTQANNSSVGSGVLRQEEFDRIKPEAQIAEGRIPIWEDPHFGEPEIRGGRRRGPNPMTEGLDGLPIVKPPYGVVAAIDLNKGDLIWQVPHGDTPDEIRNNPLLKGMNIPKTGQRGIVGPLITKTLLIVGDPQETTPPGGERGAMLRAYNKMTGEQVGAVWMPAHQSGDPMTYMVDGRQYIIVAVSGSGYSGAYISFALPEDMVEPSQSGAQ